MLELEPQKEDGRNSSAPSCMHASKIAYQLRTTMDSMYANFYYQRRRMTHNFDNPRIEKITFTSIRHWKATIEYHKTKGILHVKHLLGHKSINNTMIYIDIERAIYGELRDYEFTVRVAKALDEDQKLIEAGFEYVTERDGAKIYRKRK